jgi:hypothetical protein
MKNYLPLIVVFLISIFFVSGCDIIGTIFQTGVGVGIFIAVIILLVILFIARIGRRR